MSTELGHVVLIYTVPVGVVYSLIKMSGLLETRKMDHCRTSDIASKCLCHRRYAWSCPCIMKHLTVTVHSLH